MINIKNCPRCGNNRCWKIRRSKLRCSKCHYEWRPFRYLSPSEWETLLVLFLRDVSCSVIAKEAGLHRQRVMRALTYLRTSMLSLVPTRYSVNNSEMGRLKRAWAPLLKQLSSCGADRKIIISFIDQYRDSVEHSYNYLKKPCYHFSAFLRYFRREFDSKGGIRGDRIKLYIAEYIWRYTYRRLNRPQKINNLKELIINQNYKTLRR